MQPENKYKLTHSKRGNSYKIFAPRETQKLIAQLLAGKNCSIEMRKSFKVKGISFIEIDHRALEILLANEKELKLERSGLDFKLSDLKKIRAEAGKERMFADELRKKEYDLNKRIWSEGFGPNLVYNTKIHGDIYSCKNLDDLIALIKGDYLVEEKKNVMSFSANPILFFGIFSVAYDFISSDKSLIHLHDGQRKVDYFPLIKDVDQFRVILDGADDIGHVFADTDISHENLALIEGLLLFPMLLKAVSAGYDSLRDETHDLATLYAQKPLKQAELQEKLADFRKEICKISGLNYYNTLEDNPRQLMKKIAAKLQEIKNDPNLGEKQANDSLNEIVGLAAQYNTFTENFEAPKEKGIYAAYAGWLSMVGMMGAISAYEVQALMNIIRGVDGISKSDEGDEDNDDNTQDGDENTQSKGGSEGEDATLLSQIGATFGFGGQILMTAYALYRFKEERQEWKKVKQELLEFKKAENVSELARQVTQKLLDAKSTYHKSQTFGHAALAIGQSMMAITGPIGLKFEPLSYLGLAITLGSVGVNAISELKYKRSYEIDQRRDEIETKILSHPPQFTAQDSSDLKGAVFSHTQHQIFALEVLGHLRAPQFVLYEKFIENNKDDQGILDKSLALMGWGKFMRWLRTPPQDSIDMVKDNPQIAALAGENDIDVLSVGKNDFDFIWNISKYLSQLHALKTAKSADNSEEINRIIAQINELRRHEYGNDIQDLTSENIDIDQIHINVIQAIQNDFIDKKVATHQSTPPQKESAKEICRKIIEQGGDGALYLKRKLLRSAKNGQINYRSKASDKASNSVEITRNGKKINIGKFDLDDFEEKDLEEFLLQRRKKKGINIFDPEKKSPLSKTRHESRKGTRSDHLRPFQRAGVFSSVVRESLNKLAEEIESEENELPETSAENLNAPNDEQKHLSLLQNLDQMAKEQKDNVPYRRLSQIEKQNKIIDELSKQQNFILTNTIKRGLRTIFVYKDPNFPDSTDHQIIYDRDDQNNKINVYYGSKAQAIVVQKSAMSDNAYAAKIELEDVKEYGEKCLQTQYTSFNKIPLKQEQTAETKSPNTATNLRGQPVPVSMLSPITQTSV